MVFPIIPALALLGIVGGITASIWYVDLSKEEQQRADRLALQWFGQRFHNLVQRQQDDIRKHLS